MNATAHPAPASSPSSAVTVLITRRVRPGRLEAFEQAMAGMLAAGREFPGHLGGQLISPESEAGFDHGLHHVVFAFDTEAHLAAWQQSAARAHWLQVLAPNTVAETALRRIPGLEHWFMPSGQVRPPPPRWKVAVVTWCGICPTVWLVQTLAGPPLAGLPSFPRLMLLTALITALMTWLVAPTLTRWFAPWLFRAPRPAAG